MASSTRTQVEQDISKHTLGHVFAKLKGMRRVRTIFVIVEGSDDLAFYMRFFDRRIASIYYSTKLKDDGSVDTGGCVELQNIVKTILEDGRTDKVVGIMDTDYRRYRKSFMYPKNIFHTDHRDMEMTALGTSSVQQALKSWITDYDEILHRIEPMLRHAGKLRIVNDLYHLGCNFKRKVKINHVFDNTTHKVFSDWKNRYNKAFKKSCFRKRYDLLENISECHRLFKASIHMTFHNYKDENLYDICQGHDTISLLSLSLVNNSIYSETAIWEHCFDAYRLEDFKSTLLYSSIYEWATEIGVSRLFKN